jgi:hypothetical protein|tara:strand:- start:328 stop:615 length:288 start_codon:yes stop_codon:yes gene_type:complete
MGRDKHSELKKTLTHNSRLHDAIEAKDRRIERLEAENAELRAAGGYMLGWHPTDIDHPAFNDTVAHGQGMMLGLLEPELAVTIANLRAREVNTDD